MPVYSTLLLHKVCIVWAVTVRGVIHCISRWMSDSFQVLSAESAIQQWNRSLSFLLEMDWWYFSVRCWQGMLMGIFGLWVSLCRMLKVLMFESAELPLEAQWDQFMLLSHCESKSPCHVIKDIFECVKTLLQFALSIHVYLLCSSI